MEEGTVIECNTKEKFDDCKARANESRKLLVIDFTASWCGPCRMIAPIFADLAKKFPHVIFMKVDVDELKDVSESYSIEAMPTFLFIKDGKVIDKVVGATKDELPAKVAKHADAPSSAS